MHAEETRADVLPVHCVAYVGRDICPPRVKMEQNALPLPRSNARRQLSALQPGPNSAVAEVMVDVCRVVIMDVLAVTDGVIDDAEGV